MRWRLLFRVLGLVSARLVATVLVPRWDWAGAMADNEAEGAADGAEAAPSKKGKLKLIIAVVGFVLAALVLRVRAPKPAEIGLPEAA